MQAIKNKRVHFGEFAGPLAHEAAIFDWQLISTQELATAFDYPFSEILEDDSIPYAPVVIDASIHRYPAIGDMVNVKVDPVAVGKTSLDLQYQMTDGSGDLIAALRATHVTIGPDGEAVPIPDPVREAYRDALVDPDPEPLAECLMGEKSTDIITSAESELFPSYDTTVSILSPYIEGAELAYFEEYPRFAGAALETFISERGSSVGAMSGEKWPYKPRNWHWEFMAPVHFESNLHIDCEVVSVGRDMVGVVQEFSCGDTINISAVTEYGCFDSTGKATTFDETMLEPFR